jgi:hypothetical protein
MFEPPHKRQQEIDARMAATVVFLRVPEDLRLNAADAQGLMTAQ